MRYKIEAVFKNVALTYCWFSIYLNFIIIILWHTQVVSLALSFFEFFTLFIYTIFYFNIIGEDAIVKVW